MRPAALISILLLIGCAPSEPVVIHGSTMGTTYNVKIVGNVDADSMRQQIDVRLQRINDLMSTYLGNSELSQFNKTAPGEVVKLSDETVQVLLMARKIFEMSGGKFDVTVGPLVNLWGFGPELGDQIVPGKEEIKAAMSQVGMKRLKLENGTVVKTAETYVDLSAIAKGFGVDEIASLLESKGFENYLVEIGGELRASGLNDRRKPWKIAVERPDVFQRVPYKTIDLVDMGMATSGDYRNYFEVDGKRYSHAIDPTTGYPITHNVASVTVLAKETAMADGLATAINVMGAESGLALAEDYNLAVLVIVKTENGFSEKYSPAFERYLGD